jgi:exopolysaccharide production protein ExoQ
MRLQTERMYFTAEKWLVVGALLYFLGAIIPVLRNPAHISSEIQASDPFALLLQVLIYGAALIFMIPNAARLLRALASSPALASFLLLVLVSGVWSAAPLFTLRRALWFLLTSAFGLYFGARFEIKEQIRLLASALGVCIVLSVFFIVALPRYGYDLLLYKDAWRGVFFHKNVLGCYMVVAAITFLCFRAETLAERAGRYLCLALSVGLLIGSEAKGSYVVMLVSILLMFLYRLLHLYWKRLIPAATIALGLLALGAAYVASNADAILQALGKNATLTGRIPLWADVLAISSHNRWLGYGFGGFWATNSHSVWSMVGWMPHESHNGFIDILLELGVIGLVIFALNTVIALSRTVKLVARERTLESQWPLLMLSLILLYNMFESNLMVQNGFLWVAYVAMTVSAQRVWNAGRATVPTEAPPDVQLSGLEYQSCPQ